MREGIVIRKATLNDIDFIIETIVIAEKSGTENFGLAKSLDLSETEMRKYLKLMLEEEIDGCEFSINSFIVADYQGEAVSALAGWIEGDNEDSLPSSMLKSNLIGYFVPIENIENLNKNYEAVAPIQIEREEGCYQFEYGYTHPNFRGKGIMDLIINEHMQQALKKGVKKMQVHIFENNIASLTNYRKKGFEVKNRYESKNPLTSELFPFNVQLLLEKNFLKYLNMEKSAIIEKLTAIFREVFNDSTIVLQDDMTASDVENWDSLTHMLMISKVEDAFGVKFKLKELNKLKSVGDMISVIESKFV